ncbi:hypothetical protein H4219_005468 [Mycoemilia scoparia]|uniref:Uncharacterized protein n=1 Tax=Mycoemilia scoparia TaxID=417184 RepID=A0A9W7ZP52_9FUNG|nr:hypothetical protein H4219_005468 [Mycoemilia scoparia]
MDTRESKGTSSSSHDSSPTALVSSSSSSTPLLSNTATNNSSFSAAPRNRHNQTDCTHEDAESNNNNKRLITKDQKSCGYDSISPALSSVSGNADYDDDSQQHHGQYQVWEDFGGTPVEIGDYEPGFSWKKLWRYTGPGWMMSIAYIDPGNLESDLQTGAVSGYKLIWLLFLSHAVGLFVQILSARVGTVSGRHLAQQCRERYPKWMTLCLWVFAEMAIIGSDIQEVIGTAVALRIITGCTMWLGILVAAVLGYVSLAIQRYGIRKTEALFVGMIGVVVVCFLIEAYMSGPKYDEFFQGLVTPKIPKEAMVQAVGMIGAVIMPHNLFLHSALVQSRRIPRGANARSIVKEANFYYALESAGALLTSFIINAAIVTVFANTYYHQTIQPRSSAFLTTLDASNGNAETPLPGLYDAADVLRKSFGKAGPFLWAIGLLSAGESSTMTGTMAGQFVMEGMLDLKINPLLRMLVTRTLSLAPTLVVGVLASNHLDVLGEWLNVLQSIQLPFAVLPLLQISASASIMGSFATRPSLSKFGWVLAVGLILLNGYLLLPGILGLFNKGQLALGIVGTVTVFAYGAFLWKLSWYRF